MKIAVAVDIGGHNLRALAADETGRELGRATAETVRDAASARENITAVAALVGRLLSQCGLAAERLSCLGVGVPGAVDPERGRVILVPNVPHWDGLALGDELARELGAPVVLDNDVNLAAQGEFWKGAAQGCLNFFFMAIGTGIGGGLFLNGRAYSGSHHAAAEIGYLVLEPGRRERRHGEFGWFESVASGFALDRLGCELARRHPDSLVARLAGSPDEVRSRHVFEAAAREDPGAVELLDRTFEYLAMAIVNITALVDPETIVLGGGVSSQGRRLLDPVREHTRGYGLTIPPLRLSRLGEEAQLFGALHAALTRSGA